ncbi:hypothetical protein ES707_05858 [subsurface metagenome]
MVARHQDRSSGCGHHQERQVVRIWKLCSQGERDDRAASRTDHIQDRPCGGGGDAQFRAAQDSNILGKNPVVGARLKDAVGHKIDNPTARPLRRDQARDDDIRIQAPQWAARLSRRASAISASISAIVSLSRPFALAVARIRLRAACARARRIARMSSSTVSGDTCVISAKGRPLAVTTISWSLSRSFRIDAVLLRRSRIVMNFAACPPRPCTNCASVVHGSVSGLSIESYGVRTSHDGLMGVQTASRISLSSLYALSRCLTWVFLMALCSTFSHCLSASSIFMVSSRSMI